MALWRTRTEGRFASVGWAVRTGSTWTFLRVVMTSCSVSPASESRLMTEGQSPLIASAPWEVRRALRNFQATRSSTMLRSSKQIERSWAPSRSAPEGIFLGNGFPSCQGTSERRAASSGRASASMDVVSARLSSSSRNPSAKYRSFLILSGIRPKNAQILRGWQGSVF